MWVFQGCVSAQIIVLLLEWFYTCLIPHENRFTQPLLKNTPKNFQSKHQNLQQWQRLLRFTLTRLKSLPVNHLVHEQTVDGAVEAYEHVQLHIMATRLRCHC